MMSLEFKNFDYANPTRIIFGRHQIAKLSEVIPKDKVVVMTYGGGSIKRNGVYDQVKSALEGFDVREFGGIEANPDFDTLIKCVDLVRSIGCDKVFLLAVGGGSIVDGTKFIAAASKCPLETDLWQLVLTHAAGVKVAVPLGSVLTLPATGSESNCTGMVSRRKMNRKEGIGASCLFPVFSILDPESTMSLPEKQTANGVVDSIVHVCEQYLTTYTDVQDRYAEALIRVLIDNGTVVMKEPNNYTARANIMWAATQALNHWIDQGCDVDWATHYIGHELTAYLGMDHGRTLACIQPRVLRYNFEAKKEKLAQCAERVFGITEGSLEEKAEMTIVKLERFYEDVMKTPTHISDYGVGEDHAWVDLVVEKFIGDKTVLGENGLFTPEVVKKVIEDSY